MSDGCDGPARRGSRGSVAYRFTLLDICQLLRTRDGEEYRRRHLRRGWRCAISNSTAITIAKERVDTSNMSLLRESSWIASPCTPTCAYAQMRRRRYSEGRDRRRERSQRQVSADHYAEIDHELNSIYGVPSALSRRAGTLVQSPAPLTPMLRWINPVSFQLHDFSSP